MNCLLGKFFVCTTRGEKLVRGCGKQRLPEIFLRLYFVVSFLQWKSFVRDSGPILFRVLYIILAFAFFFLYVEIVLD